MLYYTMPVREFSTPPTVGFVFTPNPFRHPSNTGPQWWGVQSSYTPHGVHAILIYRRQL